MLIRISEIATMAAVESLAMGPEALAAAIYDVLTTAARRIRPDEELGASAADIVVERPKNRDHGDWATSTAMKFAKRLGTNPRELAQELASGLESVDGISSVEVAGPGFINVRLDAAAAGELARTIVDAGPGYGRTEALAGQSINLEFVSGNPTGPLHIGHTRWAALGDAIGRLLEASGAKVAREYYINDAGTQMDRFGESVYASIMGEPGAGGRLQGRVHRCSRRTRARGDSGCRWPATPRGHRAGARSRVPAAAR